MKTGIASFIEADLNADNYYQQWNLEIINKSPGLEKHQLLSRHFFA